jgi:hypothetical protein
VTSMSRSGQRQASLLTTSIPHPIPTRNDLPGHLARDVVERAPQRWTANRRGIPTRLTTRSSGSRRSSPKNPSAVVG